MRLTSSKRDPWFAVRVFVNACLAMMLLVGQLPAGAQEEGAGGEGDATTVVTGGG